MQGDKPVKTLSMTEKGETKGVTVCNLFLNFKKEGGAAYYSGKANSDSPDQFFINFTKDKVLLCQKGVEEPIVSDFLWRVTKDGKEFFVGEDAGGNKWFINQWTPKEEGQTQTTTTQKETPKPAYQKNAYVKGKTTAPTYKGFQKR